MPNTERAQRKKRRKKQKKQQKAKWKNSGDAGGGTTPLVMLCACHVSDATNERMQLLTGALESVLDQALKAPLLISMSFGSEVARAQTLAALEALRLRRQASTHCALDVKVCDHGVKRMSQFQHLEFLVHHVPNPERTFCLFTDDDDFSHPSRTAFYAYCGDRGQRCMLACDALLVMDGDPAAHTLQCCEQQLSAGKARIVDGREYFMFCVRAQELARFCGIMRSFGAITSPVCDLLFNSVMMHTDKGLWRSARRSQGSQGSQWLYAYNNRPSSDRASSRHGYDDYQRLLETPGLLATLVREFEIKQWTNNQPGYTGVFGDDGDDGDDASTTRLKGEAAAGDKGAAEHDTSSGSGNREH